jgi:hypothetical protein
VQLEWGGGAINCGPPVSAGTLTIPASMFASLAAGDSVGLGVNTFNIVSPSSPSSNAEVLFLLYVDIAEGQITFTN